MALFRFNAQPLAAVNCASRRLEWVEHECGVVQRLAANHAILSIHARVLHAHSTLPHKAHSGALWGASSAVKFTFLRFDRVGACLVMSASSISRRLASTSPVCRLVCRGVQQACYEAAPLATGPRSRPPERSANEGDETLECNTWLEELLVITRCTRHV